MIIILLGTPTSRGRQDRGNFVDAIRVLLDRLEEGLLVCAARSDPLQTSAVDEELASSPGVGPAADQPGSCYRQQQEEEEPGGDDGGLILQCARIFESLLHTAEDWALSQGTAALGRPPFGQVGGMRGRGRFFLGEEEKEKEGEAFADLVFAAYERTLRCQFALVARSEILAHDVAFLSCLGAAIDAASSVLFQKRRRREEAAARGSFSPGTGGSSPRFLLVRPSFVGALEPNRISADIPVGDGRGAGGVNDDDDGRDLPASCDVGAASSCLEAILRVAVEADVVSWLLDFYVRCGGTSAGGAGANSSQMMPQGSQGDGDGEACGATTRELLVEVFLSILYAQGWVNGLCDDDADRAFHGQEGSGGDNGMASTALSGFEEAVVAVIRSWTASGVSSGGEEVPLPLDQYALSLLGTNADNGGLCKLVVSAELFFVFLPFAATAAVPVTVSDITL